MKIILIVAALAAVVFFVSKKLKAKKEVVAPKKAPAKNKARTVKPSGPASLSESDSNGDYYRKPRKADK